MFVLFLFDGGPASIALGGFVARTGFFNGWVVFFLTVLGNFLPDMAFYAIGYKGRETVEKYGGRFGITNSRIAAIERFYANHPFKTLFVIKMIPFIPAVGLAAAGAVRMPLGRYVAWCSAIIFCTNSVFFGTGYYLGEVYSQVVEYQAYALVIIAFGILAMNFLYPKLAAKLGKKIDPELGKIR